MEYVLRTFGLTRRYKGVPVVDGVNMNIRRGEIYGFVGRNGAGKTTVMRLVCGLIAKSGGAYELFGKPDTSSAVLAARRRTGAIIETPSVYPEMTAERNLTEQCLTLGIGTEGIPGLLDYVGLGSAGKKKARNFSLGMRQRLGIAMSLVGSPDFLILDEPVNGLTILISSHILGELAKLATCYGFIEKGKLLKEISAADLEETCRKSVRIEVSSAEKLPLILERGLGICDFKILSPTEAEIYENVKIGELALALHAGGVELLRVREKDEDLEGYFLNLVGGAA